MVCNRFTVAATVTVILISASGGAVAEQADAVTVLRTTRTALAGEVWPSGVRSPEIAGRTRRVRAENVIPVEFEIQADLPDQYSRSDEFPAQDSGPIATDFIGSALVPAPSAAASSSDPKAPSVTQREALLRSRLLMLKQESCAPWSGKARQFVSRFSVDLHAHWYCLQFSVQPQNQTERTPRRSSLTPSVALGRRMSV